MRRDVPERWRGFLTILASVAIFVIMNSDLLVKTATLVVNVLGWETIKRIIGVLVPITLVALNAPYVVQSVHEVSNKLGYLVTRLETRGREHDARRLMTMVYRARSSTEG